MVLGKFGVYTAGPNTALIKSTGQIVIGGRLLAVPVLQRVDSLGLELRTITVRTAHGTTVNGVAVDVTGCCQVKIQGWTSKNGDGSGEMDIDYDAIRLAAQHFIGKRDSEIEDTIQKTVEGHQRAIVGTLTVEELYSDRAAFSKRIKDLCVEDMRNMGLSMVSYTVAEIVDELGYIEALGVRQTEKVKREATEGAAEHQNLARSKKGERDAAAHMNVNHEEQRMTESDKHLNMTKADAQNEVDRAVAIQKKAGQIEKAEQDAVLFVKRQEADAAETEAEREVIATRVERERFLKEINVNIPADAELYQKKNEADVVRATFAADTDRIRAIAAAESKAIRAKGKADIKILEERVRMWNEWYVFGFLLRIVAIFSICGMWEHSSRCALGAAI